MSCIFRDPAAVVTIRCGIAIDIRGCAAMDPALLNAPSDPGCKTKLLRAIANRLFQMRN
jgi:hypothetical protein